MSAPRQLPSGSRYGNYGPPCFPEVASDRPPISSVRSGGQMSMSSRVSCHAFRPTKECWTGQATNQQGRIHVRRVVLMMSVSVDGFVAGPHGHAGGFPEPEDRKSTRL